MDAIIFGTGIRCKNVLSILEKDYHILFFTDNDKKRWGTMFGDYMVKAPDEIKKYNCDIIITTREEYAEEIVEQLAEMGIEQERISCCRGHMVDEKYAYDICPVKADKVLNTGCALVQYDLCHTEELPTARKRVLICCTFYSVYTKQLIENMSQRYTDIEFSLLTKAKEYKGKIVSEHLKHIYYFRTMADLKTILEQMPVYDAMQLLWIEWEWAYFYQLIRAKTKQLNINVGGSDFYRAKKSEREFERPLIACADRVTAETKGTIQEFEEYYEESIKYPVGLLPFGVEVLDFIKNNSKISKDEIKEKYHIPLDKIVVTCGHNAYEAHQHLKIIDALDCLPENIKKQIVCVFPMTYPKTVDDYIDSIIDRLSETELKHIILTDFMNFQQMAEYALMSDVMIHVQTTDQLSSTMLEEMYAESIVIAGSWLPYQSLHEMGMYFLDVDTIPDVTAVLEDVIANMESYKAKCAGNSEIVWNHSSWDVLAPKWRALWD